MEKNLSIVRIGQFFRLIGRIKEVTLHQQNVAGFRTYQDALNAMNEFGYKKFEEVVG